jgi:anti-sigma B factor antagonist
MRIKETIKGDVTLLTLSGRMMNGPESINLHPYVKGLIEKGQIKIVVDMGKVKWFSSTGIGSLLASYTSLRNAGGDLRIARATHKIYSVFMATQLIKIFKNFDTVDEAVESYKTD